LIADYSGQELRILAHYSKDPVLTQAILAGKDIHLDTANRVFELGIPEKCLFESHPDYSKWLEKFDKERTKAKSANFGPIYGQHGELADKWFEIYPGVKDFIRTCKTYLKKNNYTLTWAGRRRRFDSTGIDKYGNAKFSNHDHRAAFNHLIQGFGADMMKKAAGEVWRYLQTLDFIARIVLIVYDELVVEAPKDRIQELVEPVRHLLTHTVQLSVPLSVDIRIVERYGEK